MSREKAPLTNIADLTTLVQQLNNELGWFKEDLWASRGNTDMDSVEYEDVEGWGEESPLYKKRAKALTLYYNKVVGQLDALTEEYKKLW